MPDRSVVRYEKDGTRTVLADKFEGKRFSGPNDVVVKSNGSIYFTDSVSGLRDGPSSPPRELPFTRFYLIKNGQVTLLDEKLRDPKVSGTTFPNGIALFFATPENSPTNILSPTSPVRWKPKEFCTNITTTR
jgi:sugar lactone lactonase YvrE